MARTGIEFSWINNTTGATSINTSVCGLLASGVAVTGKVQLKTLYRLTKVSDAVALGVDAAYDTANSVLVYYNISQFYKKAVEGTILYLYLVSKTTVMSTFIGTSDFDDMLKDTSVVGGEASPNDRVRGLGVLFATDTPAPTGTDVIYSDVIPTINALQTKLKTFETNYGWRPAYAIVDGNHLKLNASRPDFSQLGADIVSCMISNSDGSVCGEVGYPLGVNSLYPSQYNLGNGTFGRLSGSWYFTDGTSVQDYTDAELKNLGLKQALFVREALGQGGIFFNDAPTCELTTKDLCTIMSQRLRDKVKQLSMEYLATLVNTPIDSIGNNADPRALAGYKASLERILFTLQANRTGENGDNLGVGELSNVVCTFDGTDFRNTKTLKVDIKVNNTITISLIQAVGSFSGV